MRTASPLARARSLADPLRGRRSASMFCDKCGQMRYSREWKPAQWKAWKQHLPELGYDRCKPCMDDIDTAAITALVDTAPPPKTMPFPAPGQGGQDIDFPQELDEVLSMAQKSFHPYCLRAMINEWMEVYPADLRKEWSYSGALSCKTDDIKVRGWICPVTNGWFFDPGNAVYAEAFDVILGREYEWTEKLNQKSKGDAVESILGYVYIHVIKEPVADHNERRRITKLGVYLDHMVYWIYKFRKNREFHNDPQYITAWIGALSAALRDTAPRNSMWRA